MKKFDKTNNNIQMLFGVVCATPAARCFLTVRVRNRKCCTSANLTFLMSSLPSILCSQRLVVKAPPLLLYMLTGHRR